MEPKTVTAIVMEKSHTFSVSRNRKSCLLNKFFARELLNFFNVPSKHSSDGLKKATSVGVTAREQNSEQMSLKNRRVEFLSGGTLNYVS